MGKHTPGPWSLIEDPARTFADWDDKGGFRIDAPGVEQLAYVWNATNRVLTDGESNGPAFGSLNAAADARLMGAAPELLAALKLAREELSRLPHSLGYDFTHIPKIDAAIAKAEGA